MLLLFFRYSCIQIYPFELTLRSECFQIMLQTFLIIFSVIALAFALIALRVLFIKGGEFRGTCSSNNPMLVNEIGECTVCGRQEGEECKMPELENN